MITPKNFPYPDDPSRNGENKELCTRCLNGYHLDNEICQVK